MVDRIREDGFLIPDERAFMNLPGLDGNNSGTDIHWEDSDEQQISQIEIDALNRVLDFKSPRLVGVLRHLPEDWLMDDPKADYTHIQIPPRFLRGEH